MRKISDQELEEIIKKIYEGISIENIAGEIGILPNYVRRALFTRKGEIGKQILLKELEEKLPIYDIIKIYQDSNNNKLLSEIADDFGITFEEISEGLKMYELITGEKIKRTNVLTSNTRRDDLDKSEIIENYKHGVTIEELTEMHNCSDSTVRRTIKEYEEKNQVKLLKMHEKEYKKRKKKAKLVLPTDEIVKMSKKGQPSRVIAEKYNVSKDIILKILKEYKEEKLLVMINDIESGSSIDIVAKKYNEDPQKIKKQLLNFGITRGVDILLQDKEQQIPIGDIIKDYKNDMNIQELSSKYNMSQKKVKEEIRDYDKLIKIKKERKNNYTDNQNTSDRYKVDNGELKNERKR